MRNLIVSNFVTLDGYNEDKDNSLNSLFDYYHGDENFDHYNTKRMRAADTLLLNGRQSFLGNRDNWSGLLENPDATPIRREFARLIRSIEKVVVSDELRVDELAPWDWQGSGNILACYQVSRREAGKHDPEFSECSVRKRCRP